MADTTTPVYSFVLPEIDGSDGTWGTKLNSNLTALDGLLSGSANLQNASFTGTASFGGSTGTAGQVLKSQGAGANAIWTDDSNTTYTAGSGLSLTGTEFANTAPDQTVVMNAGSGISVSGTYPTFTVTNSSPDQTVGLTGTGNITISGTYPNFTINSAGGNETLAQTLALGAVTGGTDISVSSGDNIVMAANSTVDGRDVSVDGTKLDGIEASADVTDTANVTAAGALMDSELTSIASVKALNQGVATTDSPSFAGLIVDTDTLAVDSTTNRVGIGTATPSTYGGKLNITDGAVGGESTLVIANNNANQFVRVGINNNTAQIAYDNADSLAFGEATDSTTAGLTTERMRIDSTGKVGIGTTTPSSKLSIHGSAGEAYLSQTNTANSQRLELGNAFSLITGGNGSVSAIASDNTLAFATIDTERMRIDSDGALIVGKTTSASGTQGLVLNRLGQLFSSIPSGNTYHVYNTTSPGFTFYVGYTGGVINYQANNVNLSDEREKKNIEPLESKWDSVKSWSLKTFHYNHQADESIKNYGVIAQDVEQTNPEAIDVYQKDESTERKGVKEQQMMWMAIKALQEAQTRIETLETRIAALEA